MTCLLPGTEELEVKEWFKHREDLLYMREVDKQTQLITDHFRPGHPLRLKGNSSSSGQPLQLISHDSLLAVARAQS